MVITSASCVSQRLRGWGHVYLGILAGLLGRRLVTVAALVAAVAVLWVPSVPCVGAVFPKAARSWL